ncbi:MAG: hypothetical protein J1F68_04515 [Clostridiales bacterium]|nr:hypothetical protein [Clostridiales bacterium]
MKTRRALQIIVGVLSLLTVLCLLAAAVFVALVVLFPDMSQFASEIYEMFKVGFDVIANYIGLASVSFLVPLLAYCLPGALLLLAGVLMLLPNKGKQGKYVAANILALVGIAIIAIFTIVFAADLVSRTNGDNHVWFVSTFSWTSADTIVRLIFAGLLALFVIFVGAALGVKPKKEVTSEAHEEEAHAVTTAEERKSAYETVAPASVKQASVGSKTTEYVPSAMSVNDVTKGTYGNGEHLSATAIDKINKAHMLYEMGAITEEEYIKLVNVYLKK